MRGALFAFYRRRHAAMPEENLTRVSDLVPPMVGTAADPKMKTKGAETWGLLLFLLDDFRRWGARIGQNKDRVLLAGESLERMVLIWRRYEWVVPTHDIEDNGSGWCFAQMSRFVGHIGVSQQGKRCLNQRIATCKR